MLLLLVSYNTVLVFIYKICILPPFSSQVEWTSDVRWQIAVSLGYTFVQLAFTAFYLFLFFSWSDVLDMSDWKIIKKRHIITLSIECSLWIAVFPKAAGDKHCSFYTLSTPVVWISSFQLVLFIVVTKQLQSNQNLLIYDHVKMMKMKT